jgi:hypothetical protein
MCRNIKKLRLPDGTATREQIEASALQFVRKVSGYRKPSQLNTDTFEATVREISDATERMLADLRAPRSETRDW